VDVKAQTNPANPACGFTLNSTFETELQATANAACAPARCEPKPMPATPKTCEPKTCEPKPSQSGLTLEKTEELELNVNWGANNIKGSCPCEPPKPADSCHPAGSLKTDAKGVITTPGGYKVEATGKHEFTISKDGKKTRVWGDPHVEESDGGKWDFKRDSSFVLDDGTKIDVKTSKPDKNGRTYSVGLQVINGNDRVQVTDMDKGRGKVSQVTQDGRARANDFAGKDVFKMGKTVDDWSYQGKEVTGSKRDGEEFVLGKALPGNHSNHSNPSHSPSHHERLDSLQDLLSRLFSRNDNHGSTTHPASGHGAPAQTGGLESAVNSLREMFSLLSMLQQLAQRQTSFVRG
jgi:hypothetical protein